MNRSGFRRLVGRFVDRWLSPQPAGSTGEPTSYRLDVFSDAGSTRIVQRLPAKSACELCGTTDTKDEGDHVCR